MKLSKSWKSGIYNKFLLHLHTKIFNGIDTTCVYFNFAIKNTKFNMLLTWFKKIFWNYNKNKNSVNAIHLC